MKLFIDASIPVKWFFSNSRLEPDAAIALDILKPVESGKYSVIQSAHWLIEIFTFVVRKFSRKVVSRALKIIHALDFDTVDDFSVHEKAGILSQDDGHHPFDTLYHAVARDQKSVLTASGQKYFNKARSVGQIGLIKEFSDWISKRRLDGRNQKAYRLG